ncbi:MAG: crossover junction endodeoxyribonuclease RuvC [Bdellovibrionales bacterium]|nr:crossover junction endodeoxyribonuclease RuvC [Bdellovibrionales bacterium]
MNLSILGIDPGTKITGYGVIKMTENKISCLDYGILKTDEKKFSGRIQNLHTDIKHLCKKYRPHHIAIEKVFFGNNPDTAFKLGHIFALCLLESKNQNIEFFEYASRFVKKSVTFSGKSSKEMTGHFIRNFFSLKEVKGPLDGTDALAVALCHSYEYKKKISLQKLKRTVL